MFAGWSFSLILKITHSTGCPIRQFAAPINTKDYKVLYYSFSMVIIQVLIQEWTISFLQALSNPPKSKWGTCNFPWSYFSNDFLEHDCGTEHWLSNNYLSIVIFQKFLLWHIEAIIWPFLDWIVIINQHMRGYCMIFNILQRPF